MNSKFYKYCAVPLCKNTTIKTPQKLFIHVPTQKEMRKQWSRLARREYTPIAKCAYFCEDHFNIPNDMENYMEYKIMGKVKAIRMKKDCVPSRFDCQLKKKKAPRKDCEWIKKRKADEITKVQKDLVERIMKENEAEAEPTAKKKKTKKQINALGTVPVSGPKSTKTEERLEKKLQNKAQKMPLTPAERQKKYREKMQLENPDKYEECRKKAAENNKLYYGGKVGQYTEEEKETMRQRWRDSKRTTSSAKKKRPLTPAERQRRYREKLKAENPDKYEEYKKSRAEHSKLYYREKSKQYTEEEKEKMRQQWRDSKRKTIPAGKPTPLTPAERQKRYREKMKRNNPDKYEECKKRIAENNKLYYREKVRQYTEEEKEKMRQRWRDIKRKTTSAKKKRLTPAERQKRYREKLKKENPDKYLEIKKEAADYSRRYYREKLSSNVEEQWNDVRRKRLSPGERMKRYRERLKRDNPAKYVELLKKSAEKAKLYYRKKAQQYTEEEKEARRQKWRENRRINKKKHNKRRMNKKNARINSEESSSEQDAEPGPSEIPITPPWHTPASPGVSDTSAQDPLRKHTDRCRFCGELSSDCFVVSSHMPYLAGHRTTFALNDTTIQLDFNDGLPRTVCRYCDTKLQEICDFIKTVKDAQDSMHEKIKIEKQDREIDVFIKTETESTDGDSMSISDTVFVKSVSKKRKSGVTKKAKVTKPNVMVEYEKEFIIDIKQEVIDDDIESSKHSDADSETLSIPDELKRANAYFCDTVKESVVTEVIRRDKVGSETTINTVCARSPETGSEDIT